MKIKANTPKDYIAQLPAERKAAMTKLRQTIVDNLPRGFEETINYGMIGYVVPKSIYPDGYHAAPQLPLPFIHIASQKNFIALYHFGIYTDQKLMAWFKAEYPRHCKLKLDMGKSCIRFKHMDKIPFKLIGELAQKMSPEAWVARYEKAVKKK